MSLISRGTSMSGAFNGRTRLIAQHSAGQQRPESDHAGQNDQPEAPTRRPGGRINTIDAMNDEKESEAKSNQ